MEIKEAVFRAVDLLEGPALAAMDDAIVYRNPAAETCLPDPCRKVSDLLAGGWEDYRDFREGCLNVTVRWNGHPRAATVTRMGPWKLLALEPEEDPRLTALALAARELRMPMGDLLTLAEKLEGTHRARFHRGFSRLLRIVANMSDAGGLGQRFYPELTDVDSLLCELAEKLEGLLPCPFRYEGPQGSCITWADPQQLERAVLNLVSNAAKFLTEGEGITLSLRCTGSRLAIQVRGKPGIPPEQLPTLFRRYLRSPQLEDGRNGLGLGLVLVRSAAANHGGAVLVDSPQGAETRVTLTIPVRQAGEAPLLSPSLVPDYCGDQDHALVELAELLDEDAYEY